MVAIRGGDAYKCVKSNNFLTIFFLKMQILTLIKLLNFTKTTWPSQSFGLVSLRSIFSSENLQYNKHHHRLSPEDTNLKTVVCMA